MIINLWYKKNKWLNDLRHYKKLIKDKKKKRKKDKKLMIFCLNVNKEYNPLIAWIENYPKMKGKILFLIK